MLKMVRSRYTLMVFSFLMALLLWLYVINQESAGSPQNTVEVALSYVNAPADYTVKGPESVSVSMWGSGIDRGQIRAYVDLGGLGDGEHLLKVNVQPVPGALFTAVTPNEVAVTLTGAEEIQLRVTRELIGTVAPGAELGELVLSSEQCIARGDSAALAAVAVVVAPIRIEGVSGVLNQEVVLQARDANGTVLTDVTLLPSQVQVMAVVQRSLQRKMAEVELVTRGAPPAGYEVSEMTVAPERVALMGYRHQLQDITRLNTAALELSGRTADFTTYLSLEVPEAIMVEPMQVMVTVKIAEIAAEPVSSEVILPEEGAVEAPGASDAGDEDRAPGASGVGDETPAPAPVDDEAENLAGDGDEADNS